MTAIGIMYAVNSILFIALGGERQTVFGILLCYVLPLVSTMTIILWFLIVTKEGYEVTDYPDWAS